MLRVLLHVGDVMLRVLLHVGDVIPMGMCGHVARLLRGRGWTYGRPVAPADAMFRSRAVEYRPPERTGGRGRGAGGAQDLTGEQRARVTAALRAAAPARSERFIDEIERELQHKLRALEALR